MLAEDFQKQIEKEKANEKKGTKFIKERNQLKDRTMIRPGLYMYGYNSVAPNLAQMISLVYLNAPIF